MPEPEAAPAPEATLAIPRGAWRLVDAGRGLYYTPVTASVAGTPMRFHAYALAVRGGAGGLETQVARAEQSQPVYERLVELVGDAGAFQTAYIRAPGDAAKGPGSKCVVWLEPAERS